MFTYLYKAWFLKILIVINFIGTIWGFWWYHEQLLTTAVAWWPIVPDSPLSSGLFTLSLILIVKGVRSRWFHLLACLISIKYGIWAVAVISDFWLHGGQVRLMEIALLLSHLGMAAEGILYLPLAWPEKFSWIPFVVFTWLNDTLDYTFLKHPYFFYEGQLPLGLAAAVILSTVLTISALIISWKEYSKSRKCVFGKV